MTHHAPHLAPVQTIANPPATIGRMFSDTFAGIASSSVPGFVAAQVAGGVPAVAAINWWYPGVAAAAANVVVGHEQQEAAPR